LALNGDLNLFQEKFFGYWFALFGHVFQAKRDDLFYISQSLFSCSPLRESTSEHRHFRDVIAIFILCDNNRKYLLHSFAPNFYALIITRHPFKIAENKSKAKYCACFKLI
jgi:hypothetical protein